MRVLWIVLLETLNTVTIEVHGWDDGLVDKLRELWKVVLIKKRHYSVRFMNNG